MKSLVIIPCYNEEESIVRTIKSLTDFIYNQKEYEIDYVVIDDGSTDDTKKVMIDNNINHISHVVNMGVGAGIKTGIMYADKNGFSNVTQFDADGQHNAEYIIDLIKGIEEGYDVVIGSRFLGTKKHWSMRMLGSKVLSNLIYYRTKKQIKITDPTSGQRMLSTKVKKAYMQDEACSEPNFAIKYYKKGFKVKEVKVNMNERLDGESHFNLYNSITFMIEQSIAIIFGY